MAITKSFTTLQGFTAPVAYARIITYVGNKDTIQVNVQVHKDSQARLDGLQPIADYNISLELQNGATMEQMYNALKLQEPFINAIDV